MYKYLYKKDKDYDEAHFNSNQAFHHIHFPQTSGLEFLKIYG